MLFARSTAVFAAAADNANAATANAVATAVVFFLGVSTLLAEPKQVFKTKGKDKDTKSIIRAENTILERKDNRQTRSRATKKSRASVSNSRRIFVRVLVHRQ